MDSLFVHHVLPISNCPPREHPSCFITNHPMCRNGKASIAERPPLHQPTSFPPLVPLCLLGRPRSDSDPKWSPCLVLRRLLPWMDPKWSPHISCSPPGCCHGKIQSDLLNPSLLKRARALSGRPPLAFSRSPLDSLLAGFLLLFLILDDLHPRIFSLSRFTGWASLHPGEELLRGSWVDSEVAATVRFTCFTSPGLVKLLALSNQQVCVSSARRVVSPDSDCHMWFYYGLLSLRRLLEYPYQCTLRLWYLETPMTFVQRTGTAPLSTVSARCSVFDYTPPWQ